MARRVSLYIEDTEIKLLVTQKNQVEKWASLMLDPGLVNEGVILDENRVAESIKELLKLQEVQHTNVTVGITGLNSVFRIMSIPRVPVKLLPEAVANEASRILPMPLSHVYYSYQMLPSTKDELNLFLVAYPRNSTDKLLSVLHKAGLKPNLIDLAPLALARCVNANQAIIVNAWLTYVDIIILHNRIPTVIRSLSLPVEGTTLRERLPVIMEEVNRTITFYQSTYPDQPLDKTTDLYLSGDIARENESLQYISKLGYPVMVVKPALNYKAIFNPTQYMVNVGLALKGKPAEAAGKLYSMIDFNALPEAYRTPPFNWGRVLMPVGAVVAISGLAYGVLMLNSLRTDTSSLNRQYNDLQAQLTNIRADNKKTQDSINTQKTAAATLSGQAEALQNQITGLQQDKTFFDDTLTTFKTDLDNTDKDMREIVSDLPSGINITGIQYIAGDITVNGVAASQSLVLTYARSLRSGGRFASVTVSSVEALSDGTFSFNFVLH